MDIRQIVREAIANTPPLCSQVSPGGDLIRPDVDAIVEAVADSVVGLTLAAVPVDETDKRIVIQIRALLNITDDANVFQAVAKLQADLALNKNSLDAAVAEIGKLQGELNQTAPAVPQPAPDPAPVNIAVPAPDAVPAG